MEDGSPITIRQLKTKRKAITEPLRLTKPTERSLTALIKKKRMMEDEVRDLGRNMIIEFKW